MQLKFDERIICMLCKHSFYPVRRPHLLIPSIYLSRCADTQPLPNNEINTFDWVQAQYMSYVPMSHLD